MLNTIGYFFAIGYILLITFGIIIFIASKIKGN